MPFFWSDLFLEARAEVIFISKLVSVEMACLLVIQNKIQAVWMGLHPGYLLNKKMKITRFSIILVRTKLDAQLTQPLPTPLLNYWVCDKNFFFTCHSLYQKCTESTTTLSSSFLSKGWEHTLIDLHLIFKKSSLINKVGWIWFFVYFELEFCRLHWQ